MMAIEISELDMRILAELEEAGECDALSMLNTIIKPDGGSEELRNYQLAIANILEKDLIEIHMESIPTGSVPLTKSAALLEVASLSKSYAFSRSENQWTDVREKGPPYFQTPLPRLILTDIGNAKSIELLEVRGYQWWRKKP